LANQQPERLPIRRALLSVSDKNGIVALAQALHAADIQLLSTGGTAQLLKKAGLPVIDVASYTGFPEIMDGRVKTLHPRVHGGLLGRRGTDDAIMNAHGIEPIDLLVVNLYPFADTVTRAGTSYQEGVENIDVGGPAMLRAAAKNHAAVTVLVQPSDYPLVLKAIRTGGTDFALRQQLAQRAFAHTAHYDSMVCTWLSQQSAPDEGAFPDTLDLRFTKKLDLRYGENPHQAGAFYQAPLEQGASVATATLCQGKALSYNNIADADTALECVRQFDEAACVIVKHANPCGVAIAADTEAAYRQAYKTDPTSAFGGIIAFNRPVDAPTVRAILDNQFLEVLIAPSVSQAALALLETKANIRVLVTGELTSGVRSRYEYRSVTGGLLVQEYDQGQVPESALRVVSARQPSAQEYQDLLFAWRVCKHVKSNAIVYAHAGLTLGIGAGQMSRVVSSRIAAMKAHDAGLATAGAVMASDAFFPFRDGLDMAAEHGICAVIQPGGSLRDDEVIMAANSHGMAMIFTGMRHFRH